MGDIAASRSNALVVRVQHGPIPDLVPARLSRYLVRVDDGNHQDWLLDEHRLLAEGDSDYVSSIRQQYGTWRATFETSWAAGSRGDVADLCRAVDELSDLGGFAGRPGRALAKAVGADQATSGFCVFVADPDSVLAALDASVTRLAEAYDNVGWTVTDATRGVGSSTVVSSGWQDGDTVLATSGAFKVVGRPGLGLYLQSPQHSGIRVDKWQVRSTGEVRWWGVQDTGEHAEGTISSFDGVVLTGWAPGATVAEMREDVSLRVVYSKTIRALRNGALTAARRGADLHLVTLGR